MTTEREVSLTLAAIPPVSDWQTGDSVHFVALRLRAAGSLRERAEEIALRWEAQAHGVPTERRIPPSNEVRDDRRSVATAMIQSLASALAADGTTADDAIGLGLAFGTASFASGMMLHHMLRELDLLEAMCLFALEDGIVAEEDRPVALADGIRLCRRMQRASSLSRLAAARGYAQAASDATRQQFRRLRHDMRNPLGTIQSALSLMEDQSVPEEARRSPRFRAMIQRNARALDDLIVERFSDAEARSSIGAYQRISPRAIACTVRRDLRAESALRGVAIVVSSRDVHHRLDAAGIELLLHDILLSVLLRAQDPDVLTIDFSEQGSTRASIEIACPQPRASLLAPESLHRLSLLATGLGMWLEGADDRIILSFPIIPGEPAEAPPSDELMRSALVDEGKPGEDLGGERKREHWQPGAL